MHGPQKGLRTSNHRKAHKFKQRDVGPASKDIGEFPNFRTWLATGNRQNARTDNLLRLWVSFTPALKPCPALEGCVWQALPVINMRSFQVFFFGVVTCTCIPGFAPNQVSRTIDTEGKCVTHWLARSSVWDSQLWRGEPHPARSGLLSGLCRSLRAGFLTTDNLGLILTISSTFARFGRPSRFAKMLFL